MFYREVCKILGLYLFGFTTMFFFPLIIAAYYQLIADPADHLQAHTTKAFLESTAVCFGLSILLYWIGRKAKSHLFRKEAIAVVVIIWLITPAIAALPFTLSGTLQSPWQAYFEMASGLSTTGATILHPKAYDAQGKEIPTTIVVRGVHDTTYTFYGTVAPIRDPQTNEILHEGIEAVSKALLFWRAFVEWLGGLGVIVLFVAILPSLGISGKWLYQSEMTGPIKDSLSPRIGQTAVRLWMIYVSLTAVEIFLLKITNDRMEWLDAITTSLATLSTGGFSIRNASIGYYQSAYTDWIVTIFMLLGSINFTIYYYVMLGKFYRSYQPDLFLYIAILLFACITTSGLLIGTKNLGLNGDSDIFTTSEAIRHGIFQIVSMVTTTGFATSNYNIWPYTIQVIMLVLMYIGGMSGSTSGGTKVIRLYMLLHILRNKIESLFRTQKIRQFKVGLQEIDVNTANAVLCYLLVVVLVATLGTLAYTANGIDPETSLSLVTSMINNIGIGFRAAGPTESCAFLSNFGLALSSLLMILGRLEFFVVLAILMPSFWKRSA